MSYNDAFIAYAEIRGRTRFTPGDGMPAFTLEDLIAQVHRTRLARDVMTSVDISTGSSWERDTRRGMDFFEDGYVRYASYIFVSQLEPAQMISCF